MGAAAKIPHRKKCEVCINPKKAAGTLAFSYPAASFLILLEEP